MLGYNYVVLKMEGRDTVGLHISQEQKSINQFVYVIFTKSMGTRRKQEFAFSIEIVLL